MLAEVYEEAEDALVAGDLETARTGYEYVRAALGDSGRTRSGVITLPLVLDNLLACAQPLGDWAEMKVLATELVALEPEDCDAWIRLSIGQKHLGELTDATASVVRAIELDPANSNARYEHACQLAVAGQLEAALDRVAEAVQRGARRTELLADDELASLRDLPRFRELMKKR